jgi:hypothetical protein
MASRVRAPAAATIAVLVVSATRADLGGELRGADSGDQLVERVHQKTPVVWP